MTRATAFFAAWCAAILMWQVSAAEAQVGVSRYDSPSGPTLTPYLDYFRRDTGLLNRHHSFVRPRIEQQQSLRQLQQSNQQQQLQLGTLRNQVQNLRDRAVAPTGTASRFMDYSHYYRLPATSTGPR